ncbi:MAG: phage head closure protein [Planctomycetaceae bacterium]|nr:phage head closure protein [Planctomycetaceae bacterium]
MRVERQEEDLGLGIKRKWSATGRKAWVSITMLSGQELVAAQQLEARASCLLETHWTDEIRPGDRLVAEASGRIFNIVSADNVAALNRELALTCAEVVQS